MAIIFEQIHTPGIAQLSYLVGDPSIGKAAVIDPRSDVDVYLKLARKHGVGITHIFDTHIHVDFLSGSRELQARLPNAKIFASHEGGADSYGFDHEPVWDGDSFEFGDFLLTARHTPGHTLEHVSYTMAEIGRKDSPWAVFSGDSLFVNSVGRPDLMGDEETQKLAEKLHDTITRFYSSMEDGVTVFPCHGSGSSCGPAIGDLKSTTIGYERMHNPYLLIKDRKQFIREVLEEAAPEPEPNYYKPMNKVNTNGPEILGGFPVVPTLPVEDFKKAVKEQRGVLLDTRGMLAFGGGHIPGALNLGADAELSPWAGWMLKFDDPLLLVLDKDAHLEAVVRLLWRSGHVKFAGYLVGGMKSWGNAGLPLRHLHQITVHALKEAGERMQIIDVRTPSEWNSGHIPGARHFFLPYLRENLGKLDRERTTVTYCDSGYRASIAASVLLQEGFAEVRNVPGSWQAWTKAGYPVEGGRK